MKNETFNQNMNAQEITSQAKTLTVINDGQVQYPVATAALQAWVAVNGEITTANYDKFCADVSCVGEKEIGTPGNAAMIDLCAALIDGGADCVRL